MRTEDFDERRTIRALDKLFKENEELKARLSMLERLVNQLYEMKELKERLNDATRKEFLPETSQRRDGIDG